MRSVLSITVSEKSTKMIVINEPDLVVGRVVECRIVHLLLLVKVRLCLLSCVLFRVFPALCVLYRQRVPF